jgi:hypothetical protein
MAVLSNVKFIMPQSMATILERSSSGGGEEIDADVGPPLSLILTFSDFGGLVD